MSVNPLRLANDLARPDTKSVPCSKCGCSTYAKAGVCRACRNGESLPDPKTLATDRIVTYRALLKSELERRRAELAIALEDS